MELQRQMGFGSYQTVWSWLRKIPRAPTPLGIRPDRELLQDRVEVDEGGARPGKSGRGAAGNTMAAGTLEAKLGKGRKRPLGRLRLAIFADASARSLKHFIAADTAKPLPVTTDGWSGYRGLQAKSYQHQGDQPQPLSFAACWPRLLRKSDRLPADDRWGDASLWLPAIHLVFSLAKRWLLGPHHGAVRLKQLQRCYDEFVFRFNHRKAKAVGHDFARLIQHTVKSRRPLTAASSKKQLPESYG